MSDRAGPTRVPFPDVLDPLTGVRFFLALGVVLFHFQLYWTLPAESAGLLNRARLGVDVFFILSGFILTHVYLQGDRAPNYGRFRRRASPGSIRLTCSSSWPCLGWC